MEENNNENKYEEWKTYLRTMSIVLLITYLLVTYVVQLTIVNGSSMNSTLKDNDLIIVEKIKYYFSDPDRFDVIVFEQSKSVYYVKRIIALPGETIQIGTDGKIWIDGEILDEDFGAEVILDPGIASVPISLGEDEYFVLGDNRNNSSDSRDPKVGVVSKDDIVGDVWIGIPQ